MLTPERCAGIAAALDANSKITRHRFNVAGRSLTVEHEPGLKPVSLIRAIARAPSKQPVEVMKTGRPGRHVRSLATLAAGSALALAGQPLAVPLIGLGAVPIFRRAVKRLQKQRLGVDALDATAMTITVLTGQWLTAALIGALVEGGELLRDMTASRSRRELGALMSHQGATCWKLVDGRHVAVKVASIGAGDRLVVGSGDRVPVDGTVVRGRAVVDERVLTGEPMPVPRKPGDLIYAMTVVTDGELVIEAASSAAESRAGRIMTFLERAPIGETRMADHARKIADRFVLPVMAAAAAVYLLTGNASRAASILIFDLATGIRVAAPTTMLASLISAAREGILIKGAAAMEKLATVDAIVFDKTGTLTMGQPTVTEVNPFNGLDEVELLAVAAGADHGLNHPLATALAAEAERRNVRLPRRTSTEYHVGLGVEAQLDNGEKFLVGNREFMATRGVKVPKHLNGHGLSEVVVASKGECLGAIVFADEPRPEAGGIMGRLRSRGVERVVLLSGDTENATRRVADALGIDEWAARTSPDQKAEVVRKLKAEGHRVAVVGDGVNDSLALSLADLSIAMGGGADVARANSDVVLLDDRLELIPRAIDRSRESLGLMNQNLALIVAPNALGMGGALAGAMNPAVAAFLSNGSTVVAAANGLRPLLDKGARRATSA
jgi:Cu2+-exporting ATPase